MKRNKTLLSILITLLMVILGSCQKDELIGGTAVKEMSGEWWVQGRDSKGAFPYGSAYAHVSTYNTAANTATEMWVEDGYWGTKFKVPVDLANLSFAVAKQANSDPNYKIDIKVTDGKVIKNGSKGPVSKAVTDSIFLKVEYSDEPGSVFYLSGYRRTKFAEDDH